MSFKTKRALVVLCDHCMSQMKQVEFQVPGDAPIPALYCDLCHRVYTPTGGYRDMNDRDDKRLFLQRCQKHMQALCTVGFAGEANEKMRLVCPVEGCGVSLDAPLSSAFQRGY